MQKLHNIIIEFICAYDIYRRNDQIEFDIILSRINEFINCNWIMMHLELEIVASYDVGSFTKLRCSMHVRMLTQLGKGCMI